MTKNNYNAEHIELGKKFLANENVNIDLDDDRLLLVLMLGIEFGLTVVAFGVRELLKE